MRLTAHILFRWVCYLMRCDPVIMAAASGTDRICVVGDAALLLLLALFSGTAWMNFIWMFAPLAAALCVGAFFFCFIPLLDVAIAAADWRPKGILARPGGRFRWTWLGQLGLRLCVGFVLSLATSEGATQWLCHEAIMRQLEADVIAQNRETEDRFETQKAKLRKEHFGPLLAEIDRLNTLVKDATGPLDQAHEVQATAQNRVEVVRARAEKELHGGPGFPAGPGPRYKAALAELEAAQADLVKANAQVTILQPRVKQAGEQLKLANDKLAEGEKSITGEITALEQTKQSQLVTLHSDPLLNHQALEEVFQDPRVGESARYYHHLLLAAFMVVDFVYLLVRIIFAHASVYTVLLIKDVKLRAETAEAEYRDGSERLRARWRQAPSLPPPLTLISFDPPPGKPSNDDEPSDEFDDDEDGEAAD
jgi:hypothetical protein